MEQSEREYIIKDIINHDMNKTEVEEDTEYTRDISEFRKILESQSDSKLENWWRETVGKWISYMRKWNKDEYRTASDIMVWESNGYETVIDWQFNKLITEGKTDYSYLRYEYEQPY